MNSSLDSLKNEILSRLESLTITTKGLSQLNAPAVEPEPKGKVATYTIGTWSHKIKPSVVRKRGNGTSEDIALLRKPTNYNKSHETKRTINPGERRRVRKVAKIGTGKRDSIQENGEPVGNPLDSC